MSNSFAKHTHRIFQAFEGKRKHAIADQLLNDACANILMVLFNNN